MALIPDPIRFEVGPFRRAVLFVDTPYSVTWSKSIFDKVFALISLILLCPVMLAIAITIFAAERQSVLFRQTRIGAGGKPFQCWKFRTMARDADKMLDALLASDPKLRAEWETAFKLRDDPRVTSIGGFLRKTSLDELPQFWNVLIGQMSIVGPRPIVLDEVAQYGDCYWAYRCVRPGITGLWQVEGRSDTNYARRVAMDVEYALKRSIWRDIIIILKTVRVVLFRIGAY